MDEQRAGRLQALAHHPAWPDLIEAIDDYRASYAQWLSNHILLTGEVPDDVQYKRGFLAGMKYVSRYPGIAEKTLDRAIAKSKTEGDE